MHPYTHTCTLSGTPAYTKGNGFVIFLAASSDFQTRASHECVPSASRSAPHCFLLLSVVEKLSRKHFQLAYECFALVRRLREKLFYYFFYVCMFFFFSSWVSQLVWSSGMWRLLLKPPECRGKWSKVISARNIFSRGVLRPQVLTKRHNSGSFLY